MFVQDAPPPRLELMLEGGSVSSQRNVVRVPGNGTTVNFRDLIGRDGKLYGRTTLSYRLADGRGLRLVIAPLSQSGNGILSQTTDFDGATFAAGVPTEALYRFDSYRLTYWTRVRTQDVRSDFRAGFTLKVRDAAVGLRQGSLSRRYVNTGLVPLIYFGGSQRLDAKNRLIVDFDGLVAPQGRALDLGLFWGRELTPNTELLLGVRALNGGADNDNTYNDATFFYLSAGVGFRF